MPPPRSGEDEWHEARGEGLEFPARRVHVRYPALSSYLFIGWLPVPPETVAPPARSPEGIGEGEQLLPLATP